MTEQEQGVPIEQRGPFVVNSREIIHDKFSMQLFHDKVIRPDGSEGDQYWVNFPREAVLIFPMDDKKRLYLTREFTYGTNEYSIEAAGGVILENESPDDAALRKVREELGLEVDSLTKIATFKEITSRVNNVSHTYLARVREIRELTPDSANDISRQVIALETALEMVRNGGISTGVIAAAIWRIHDLANTEDI